MPQQENHTFSLAIFLTCNCIFAIPTYGGNGDFDNNEILDLADFAAFQRCFTGPPANSLSPECNPKDLDIDNDIDTDDWAQFVLLNTGANLILSDFAEYQRCFTGPAVSILPLECAQIDQDLDDDIDLDDWAIFESGNNGNLLLTNFAAFQTCFTGSTNNRLPQVCTPGDHDFDDDIDLDDWAFLEPRLGFRTGAPKIDRFVPAPGTHIVDDQGLTQVQVGFDKPVMVSSNSVSIWTVGGGVVSTFSQDYDDASRVLSIVFDSAIRDDRVTVIVDYTVVDLDGQELDGEISSPSAAILPSGNGVRGGQSVFRINVLQGDVDRNGVVNTADGDIIGALFGICAGDIGFDPAADLNGDGCITGADAKIFIPAQGRMLPPVDGVVPSIDFITPDPNLLLPLDLSDVVLHFSEPIDSISFNEQTLFLIDSANNLVVPQSVALSGQDDVITFQFPSPLPQCSNYSLNIGNAFADASGMLIGVTIPSELSGLRPPPPPTIGPHPSVTMNLNVTLSVSTFGSTSLDVHGPGGDQTVQTDPAGGAADVEVLLAPDQLNQLFLTSQSACGITSAVASTAISNDAQPPDVFIDFPQDGVQIQANTTDVAGRVGDRISGFAGLNVLVNGQPAEVNIGVGTAGTFFLPGLTLDEDQPTNILVTATDSLGNQEAASITVDRIEIPAGSPRLLITSGNAQTGQVDQPLASPLLVQMLRGDGTPFVGKVVTFDVTRSNGRLADMPGGAGSMVLQVRTDDQGIAQAFLTLGSDAGCGNNRVEVTSRDIAGTIMFCASATPAPADRILVGDVNNQRGEVAAPLPLPLRVWVCDGNNGVPGVPVTFTAAEGDGIFSNGQPTITQSTDATGHVDMPFTLGVSPGRNVVEADFVGNPGLPASFIATGVARIPSQPTTLTGTVLDNANRAVGGARVTLSVGGASDAETTTDVDGRFTFNGIASGAAEVVADGSVATLLGGQPIAPSSFPFVGQDIVIVPNAANELSGPIRLPMLDPINTVVYDGTQDVILSVDGIEGLELTVRAGTVVALPDGSIIDGTSAASVPLRMNQVHFDEIPMPLPDGAFAPFAWTLQPKGATFDPPIQVALPNMAGLEPGSIAYILQWDGEMNEFVINASGQVSDDGSMIHSDPSVGISLAGWGGFCPPYPPTGDLTNDFGDDPNSPCPQDLREVLSQSLGLSLESAKSRLSEVDRLLGLWFDSAFTVEDQLELVLDSATCILEIILFKVPVIRAIQGITAAERLRLLADALREINCDLNILEVFDLADMQTQIADKIKTELILGIDSVILAASQFNQLHSQCGTISPDSESFVSRADGYLDELQDLRDSICEPGPFEDPSLGGVGTRFRRIFRATQSILNSIQNAGMRSNNVSRSGMDEFEELVGILEQFESESEEELAGLSSDFDRALALRGLVDTSQAGEFESIRSMFSLADWSVTFNGQVVELGSDGRFEFRGIPATGTLSRIHFKNDGLLVGTSGRTSFFIVPFNDRLLIGEKVTLSDEPFPFVTGVRLDAAGSVIEVAETTLINTVLHLSNLSVVSGQTSFDGTTYRSSNVNVATASTSGVIMGVGAGAALITVSNEGVSAVKRFTVVDTAASTTIEGFVVNEDGSTANGATIETNFGGSATTDSNGFFSIFLSQAPPDGSVIVSASLDVMGQIFGGNAAPTSIVPNGVTDTGVIMLTPGLPDRDGDCVPDQVEITLGLDPDTVDSDSNGIPDGDEDFDGDGLSNCGEALSGTDATVVDTDGDGITDDDEDADLDNLTNAEEMAIGTDPGNTDTDGDSWPDGAEVLVGSDPLDPLSRPMMMGVSSPPIFAVLANIDDTTPLGVNVTVAAPPISVALPATGDQSILGANTTVGDPPVSVVLPATGDQSVLGANTTVADPPVEVEIEN